MSYEEVSKLAEALPYRDKFRLAQLLIQLARKEEEGQHPAKREADGAASVFDEELMEYILERLLKLRPSRKDGVLNSIGAMFQFRGGIGEEDKEKLFSNLLNSKRISMNGNRVLYPDAPAS